MDNLQKLLDDKWPLDATKHENYDPYVLQSYRDAFSDGYNANDCHVFKYHIQVYDEFSPSIALGIYRSCILPLIGDTYRFNRVLYEVCRRELFQLDSAVINIWCVKANK